MRRMHFAAAALCALLLINLLMVGSVRGFQGNRSSATIVGSSSMTPLIEEILSRYAESSTQRIDDIRIESFETEVGFRSLEDGMADFAMCSRKFGQSVQEINFDDATLCYDVVAMIVNPRNPIRALPLEDIAMLYYGEVRRWEELGEASMGMRGDIHVYSRATSSGTRFTVESALPNGISMESNIGCIAASDSDMIQKVTSDPYAFGFVSYAYLLRMLDEQALAVRPLRVGATAPWDLLRRPAPLVAGDDLQAASSILEEPIHGIQEALELYPFIRPFRLLYQMERDKDTEGAAELARKAFFRYIQDGEWRVGNRMLDVYLVFEGM